MESAKDIVFQLNWDSCPVELLCMIFSNLTPESLFKCMYVCRMWNSVALYITEKKNLWEKMVNELIVDRGKMVKMKSLGLSWKDIFQNSLLWSLCNKAEVTVYKNIATSDLKHLHVYKDNLILVTSNGVMYYDITKSEFKREIKVKCIDFLENDDIIMKVTRSKEVYFNKQLHLYGKRNFDDFNLMPNNETIVNRVVHYSLDKENCYVYDSRGHLTRYKLKHLDWSVSFLARYYGSEEATACLHIFDDRAYVLLKWGHLLRANKQTGFEKVMGLWYPHKEPPSTVYVKMFHKFGVVYGVHANKEYSFHRYDIGENKVFVMHCPGLTCAREHGEMLFLGYFDGKIEFFMPREINQEDTIKRQHHITQMSKNLEDTCIISIDVYDERDKHHVFVATHTQVYHLLLEYTNMNDYIWSDYPGKMSMSADRVFNPQLVPKL